MIGAILTLIWLVLAGTFIFISALVLPCGNDMDKMGEFILGKYFKKIYNGTMIVIVILTIILFTIV